jgi:hypothetical protein
MRLQASFQATLTQLQVSSPRSAKFVANFERKSTNIILKVGDVFLSVLERLVVLQLGNYPQLSSKLVRCRF